jgi:DNA polymerase-3 subunit delta
LTPSQLLSRIQHKNLPAAVLLLGPEAYERRRLKEAFLRAFPSDAIAHHDLAETTLGAVLDDARSLSLFATDRLIWVFNAEAALPRGRGTAEEEEAESAGHADAAFLNEYLKNPTPGVTVVFEASRFDFEGDDKRKQERVRRFYGAIAEIVELRRFSVQNARQEAEALARDAGMQLEPDVFELLVEALGADMSRIQVEMEKLSLFAAGRRVGLDEVARLVPDARSTNIFALVNALGRRDRFRALDILDTLAREGEYFPLALAFLATQFRMALVAREAGLKSAQQVQTHFTRLGIPMWSARAEQIWGTASKFNNGQLQAALRLIYEADKGLRDARPDDRVVMEQFILQLVR